MSIGAGAVKSGSTLAGNDAVIPGVTPRQIVVDAMRYEGSTRDWELDEQSNFVGVTPNEQAVVLALCVKRGSIKSSPDTGNTLHEIKYLGAANLAADITNRVMSANPIARLVDSKSISIVKIEHQVTKSGLKVAVYFKDLETDKNKTPVAYWRR